jgi:FAD synthetase
MRKEGDHEPTGRVKAYISNVALALEKIKSKLTEVKETRIDDQKILSIVDLAKRYLDDAIYYIEQKKDTFTALACIAYAEGLLDALRWLGIFDFEWEPLTRLLERPKVLVAGTFDIIHPGHIELLRQAWNRGRVYVVVARDETVRAFKKRPPIIPEEQRAETLSSIRYVHKVVLGSKHDIMEPVRRIRPDIILLGPDQWVSESWLEEQLQKNGLTNTRVERLKEKYECPLCSSTSIACRAAKILQESDNCKNNHAKVIEDKNKIYPH